VKLAVVGGGVSGISAAIALEEMFPKASITLFEAGKKLGGKVGTIFKDGFLIEEGPDSINAQKEETTSLAFDPILPKTHFCTLLGKGKVDFSNLKRANIEPSLERSLGDYVSEAYGEWAVPLFAGVYGGDPDRVSSLILSGKRVQSPWGVSFIGLKNGIGEMVDNLATKFKRTEVVFKRIQEITSGGRVDDKSYDGVICAVPARKAPYSWDLLNSLPVGSAGIVTYETEEITEDFGSGVICRENGISGATFSSVKWEGRSPKGKGLARVFFYELNGDLEKAGLDFLVSLGVKPIRILLKRAWENEIPIFSKEHYEIAWKIEQNTGPVQFTSINASGIPDCLSSGRYAVERLAKVLEGVRYGT